jgi:hypothetical protein
MKLGLVVIASSGAVDLDSATLLASAKWDTWKTAFRKTYPSTEEDLSAYLKFQATDERINSHNAKGGTWTMGHNQFSAMTPQEFSDFVGHNDLRRQGPFNFADFSKFKHTGDVNIDWVAKGAVTPGPRTP